MKKNFRLKTLCCLIALSGCGGGSSSSELTDDTIQTIQPLLECLKEDKVLTSNKGCVRAS